MPQAKKRKDGTKRTHAEWAEKDPKGYQEANNTVKGSGIKIGYGG